MAIRDDAKYLLMGHLHSQVGETMCKLRSGRGGSAPAY